jgi:preprotein translocase subunit SecB
MKYPLELSNIFFGRVALERVPTMPDEPVEINFEVTVRVIDKDFPEGLEVHLRIETTREQPVNVSLVVVGKFTPIKGLPKPDHSILKDFVNERALYTLWIYAHQMITQVSSQMAIQPIHLPPPPEFEYSPQEEPSSD